MRSLACSLENAASSARALSAPARRTRSSAAQPHIIACRNNNKARRTCVREIRLDAAALESGLRRAAGESSRGWTRPDKRASQGARTGYGLSDLAHDEARKEKKNHARPSGKAAAQK